MQLPTESLKPANGKWQDYVHVKTEYLSTVYKIKHS